MYICNSVQKGIAPHITQLAAIEMESGDLFTTYILPQIPIELEEERVNKISFNGSDLFHKGRKVDSLSIHEGLNKFLDWIDCYRNVVLIAHNGRVFDFRVLTYALSRNNFKQQFITRTMALVDSFSIIRSTHNKLAKYTQEFLAQHLYSATFDAHDALENVKMLCRILSSTVTNCDYLKFSYDPETHFLQEKFNLAKAANLPSLNVLVGNGIMKMHMAETIAGSGLNIQHLKVVYSRASENGLRNVFSAKNCIGKPRVTSDSKVLDRVVPKLCKFLSN